MKLTLNLGLSLIGCFIACTCFAQKLPNKQTVSVRAEADMKVDGKVTNNAPFQAYNNATETYYTLSNDDANLYLTVQATYKTVIGRIMNGGLTISIQQGEKNAKQKVAITYPVYEGNNRMTFSSKVIRDHLLVEATGKEIDSMVKVNNDRMDLKSKSIRVIGIDQVDTLISVYNDVDIKAKGAFDNKLNYTYELAIPLKYIMSLLTSDKKFTYQIKINEVAERGITIERDAAGKVTRFAMAAGSTAGQPATDFWGEYTLAPKP